MNFFDYDTILSFLTLTGLEIVLGVDNVIFIALIVQHLEKNTRKKARFIGLVLALLLRIIMLFFATWIMQLTYPLFTIFSFPVSGRSLMLIFGGLFLIVKTIMVDGARTIKRMLPAPQGRAYRIVKRSNHVTIIVDTKNN